MPTLLPKQGGDTAMTISGMLLTELNHSLQEILLPKGLLFGSIPVARSRHF